MVDLLIYFSFLPHINEDEVFLRIIQQKHNGVELLPGSVISTQWNDEIV